MSDVIPHTRAFHRLHNLRAFTSEPVVVDYRDGHQRPTVQLRDGKHGAGSCLGCYNSPCMRLNSSEQVMPKELDSYPGNPDLNVCPTDAILWNENLISPLVVVDKCIGCGLCAARCPYGAISLMYSGCAVVHDDDPDSLTTAAIETKPHIPQIATAHRGALGRIETPSLRRFPESVLRLPDGAKSLLVRNLLIQVGFSCRIRRQGDTNMRIDAAGSLDDGRIAVIEIELSNCVLESPRALLEDLAVLHGRYKIDIARVDPVSVILSLPNVRSEYYQVIDDIHKILGVRCRTITIGALLSLVWRFCRVQRFAHDLFVTSTNGADLGTGMRQSISTQLSHIEPYLGSLYTTK
jgi:Fe-S-cluster-containing hydrogenase component 2